MKKKVIHIEDVVKDLLDLAHNVNNDIFPLTKSLLLCLIAYSPDGVQFRELKAALTISDGKLAASLDKLVKQGYVTKENIEFENKSLQIFSITELGKKEVKLIIEWMRLFQEVGNPPC